MEYYYKNVVLTDMENFWIENAPEEYPVRQYAEAKGFDQDLFANFYHKVCNNEPLYTWHPAMWNGDKSATFFYLTDEEQTTFADFINYYNTVSEWKFWAYSDDTAWAIVNSYDKIDEYWRTPRTVAEDQYHEQRTYTAPFMYDQWKPVDIPDRYEPEWYYPVDDSLIDKWNLSPTSAETPFEDIPTWDYANQTLQWELWHRSTYHPQQDSNLTK